MLFVSVTILCVFLENHQYASLCVTDVFIRVRDDSNKIIFSKNQKI